MKCKDLDIQTCIVQRAFWSNELSHTANILKTFTLPSSLTNALFVVTNCYILFFIEDEGSYSTDMFLFYVMVR